MKLISFNYLDQKKRKSSIEKREEMLMFALKTFKEQLGLESEASLEGNVEIREIPEGYEILYTKCYFFQPTFL